MNYIMKLIKEAAIKKTIVFGTGLAGKALGEWFEERVAYFVDNDVSKHNTLFLDKPVLNPEILLKEKKGEIVVIVASMFYEVISDQLKGMGFKAEKDFWNGMALYNNLLKKNDGKTSQQTIKLEYPVNPAYRYGYGKPPHPELYDIINKGRDTYERLLLKFQKFERNLLNIKKNIQEVSSEIEPYWENNYMSGLDAISLYAMLGTYNPKTYLEIGSGNSTKFARKSIGDNGLRTKIISIDPSPRAEIDLICHEIHRKPVEETELDIFNQLEEGDFLFVDNSHRCFTNSDVTVFFLEILPRLKKGVVVEIHDIYLPYDYPDTWKSRYYSEQYLLACYLLSGGNRFEILLANQFITKDDQLIGILDSFWENMGRNGVFQKRGSSFWMRVM